MVSSAGRAPEPSPAALDCRGIGRLLCRVPADKITAQFFNLRGDCTVPVVLGVGLAPSDAPHRSRPVRKRSSCANPNRPEDIRCW